MTLEAFRASMTSGDAPPADLDPPLAALWWQGKGDWQRAHGIVQNESSEAAAWVHAHLHRVEGDLGNAGYWYRRAGRPMAAGALEAEWAAMVEALLAERG
jgi:hypothetical protein